VGEYARSIERAAQHGKDWPLTGAELHGTDSIEVAERVTEGVPCASVFVRLGGTAER